MSIPRVLSIAGSDPSGGAGIQADIKSIAANGGYGMAAVTALTAQNTRGVRGVHIPPPQFLVDQLEAISEDIQIDAVKIGMLANAATIEVVTGWLGRSTAAYVVLDPVMVATSGDRLLDADTSEALSGLIARAGLITPNIPELAVLAGTETAGNWEEATAQARQVARKYGVSVLAKGGHLRGERATDLLVWPGGSVTQVSSAWIDTPNTHGTGCSLSSAIATRVVEREGDWESAVRVAKTWLTTALAAADDLQVGSGHGPLHHFAGSPGAGRRARRG